MRRNAPAIAIANNATIETTESFCILLGNLRVEAWGGLYLSIGTNPLPFAESTFLFSFPPSAFLFRLFISSNLGSVGLNYDVFLKATDFHRMKICLDQIRPNFCNEKCRAKILMKVGIQRSNGRSRSSESYGEFLQALIVWYHSNDSTQIPLSRMSRGCNH